MNLRLLATLGLAVYTCTEASAQEFIPNPSEPVNDFISIGEFDTDEDVEGWGWNNSSVTTTVENGVLKVTTVGGDPWFFRAGFEGALDDFNIVEVRLRVVEGSGAGWEMFWGDAATPGFAAERRIGYQMPTDDDFFIVHYDFTDVTADVLTHFRLDPTGGAGVQAEIDYVRVGTISPDRDNDGLPDRVETDTGEFVDARDTGSDPDDADTDGDGFSDGIEVRVGTNPLDSADFPIQEIERYTRNRAVYVIDETIDDNEPTILVGEPVLFTIAPDLPAGLEIDDDSGEISGVPEEAAPATDYTVTVEFEEGPSATFTLNIEVRSPYIEYTVKSQSVVLGDFIPFETIIPTFFGPTPESFSISPELPGDLVLDAQFGDISGEATELSPPTEYTITASYFDFPDSSTTITLSVLGRPIITVDPEEEIEEFITLGEFETEDDFEGWNPNGRIAPFTNVDGALQVETVGGDPFFSRGFDFGVDCRIIEYRMRVTESSGGWQHFWGEDAVGRGNFGAAGQPINVPEILVDDEYHVYRIDYTDAVAGPLLAFRFDPGGDAGTIAEIDYIRLLGCSLPAEISISQGDDGAILVSWTSGEIESADSVLGPWSLVEDSSPLTVAPTAGAKYYRIAQ